MPSGLILSEAKTPPSGREWATAKVGGDRMSPELRILPLSSAKELYCYSTEGDRNSVVR